MTNHKELLDALAAPMPFKYRAQSSNEYGSNLVAYVDSRQVAARLDEVFGLNWSDEYHIRNGSTFCRITVTLPDGKTMFREDLGTESATEKEKGEVSDAFKRAAVKFGVGRFLYDMGIARTDALEHGKNKQGKPNYVPCVDKADQYSKLTNPDDLNAYAAMLISAGGDKAAAKKAWADYKKAGGSRNAENKAKYRYLAVDAVAAKMESEKPFDPKPAIALAERYMTAITQNGASETELEKLVKALAPDGLAKLDAAGFERLNGILLRFRTALVTRTMLSKFDTTKEGSMTELAKIKMKVEQVYGSADIPTKIYNQHPAIKTDLDGMNEILTLLDK